MKRFVWRLQRVLDVKTKQEQTKRAELLELTERLAGTRGALLAKQKVLDDLISQIKTRVPKQRIGAQEFFLKYSSGIDEQIKKLKKKIEELELQRNRKIAEVLAVRRFKKGLERLRAETKRQFIEEMDRLEQKELDEGAAVSFARKGRN